MGFSKRPCENFNQNHINTITQNKATKNMPKILLTQLSIQNNWKYETKRTSFNDENWTMTNEFYSCEWKVNDVDWISYIMDEN